MNIYEFYPMKKRKIWKTPKGSATASGRTAGTLGTLKKPPEAQNADNSIEILWDNKSPSPTTTIALGEKSEAGQQKRQTATKGSDDDGMIDLSFVVERFKGNTSPVVGDGHSALLDMWISKDQKNVGKDDWTSPTIQTRKSKKRSPLSTPLTQRKSFKRTNRKATRRFMLEIRKLVDEIQKSDLSSGGGSQSQRDGFTPQEEENEIERWKNYESTAKLETQAEQFAFTKVKRTTAEAGTTTSDRFLEDTFEWTEDDMDDLILTCALSSSGKGSLAIPQNHPRPKFGFSPSQTTIIPDTQILPRELNEAHAKLSSAALELELSQRVMPRRFPKQDNNGENRSSEDTISLDEDDSLLAAAANEFEISQRPQEVEPKSFVREKNSGKNNEQNSFGLEDVLNLDEDDSMLAAAANEIELSQEIKPKVLAKKKNFESENKLKSFSRNENSVVSNSGNNILAEETNVDADDSLLVTAAQEFELSQKLEKSQRYAKTENCKSNGKSVPTTCCFKETSRKNSSSSRTIAISSKSFAKTANENSLKAGKNPRSDFKAGKLMDKSSGVLCDSVTSTQYARAKLSTPGTSFEKRACANENHSRNSVRTELRENEKSSSPLKSTPGDFYHPTSCQSRLRNMKNARVQPSCFDQCNAKKVDLKEKKSRQVQDEKARLQNEFDFLLHEENFTALLEDFNFEDELKVPLKQTKSSGESSSKNSAPTLTNIKKTTYSRDEIERKRQEAQRRRFAKRKSTQKQSNGRICKR